MEGLEKPVKRVLLVEDDPNDEEMSVRALKRAWPTVQLEVARDGLDALNLIEGGGDTVPYDLVYLDIKLPRKSGIELLESIRKDDRYLFTPVVMLTSSAETKDVRRCTQLGANSFIQKALDYKVSIRNLGLSIEHWLSVNHSPR